MKDIRQLPNAAPDVYCELSCVCVSLRFTISSIQYFTFSMKAILTRFRVTSFRSIVVSGWIRTNDLTCLVGTSESGKRMC